MSDLKSVRSSHRAILKPFSAGDEEEEEDDDQNGDEFQNGLRANQKMLHECSSDQDVSYMKQSQQADNLLDEIQD